MGTMRSAVVSGAVVVALVLLGAWGAPAASAAAPDPYNPSVSTECGVTVPTRVSSGARLAISLRVTANSGADCVGDVRVQVRGADDGALRSSAAVLWSRTVRYEGEPLRLRGPALPDGRYVVTSQFNPDDASFADCDGRAVVTVGGQLPDDDPEGPGGSDDNDENAPAGGFLPDTGGPDLLWLLLGIGMVGTGAVVVARSRRREPAAVA
ncbi:LPXTG cell wall anchor domain-containing protein [Nocardioides sp. TF02-7]|uniref:LPXTG cell wall anchor domain-containing protein n=1 Tax=Nocardioides sp. TF02-7 TaxID=2917724 RepID=UPI001F051705|nr:LPXTG cell wall anchor domain-containing protein [Nocardioides sp. TF02-7]UMG93220.1 LPXTG cell wall anchor domain-containing protein [Nocardioides sp. TF02-7]